MNRAGASRGLAVIVAAWAVCAQTPARAAQAPAGLTEIRTADDRLDRLSAWVQAAATHKPGRRDEALGVAERWTLPQLQGLWIDSHNLAALMRNPRLNVFSVTVGDGRHLNVVYTTRQRQRLLALACAAAGRVEPEEAKPAPESLAAICNDLFYDIPQLRPPELLAAGRYFAVERRQHGDDNMALWRAAVLHSDAAMLSGPGNADATGTPLPVGPQGVRVRVVDGLVIGVDLTGLHWFLARALLGHIQPAGAARPEPQLDDTVRQWYRDTTTWMEGREQYDQDHIDDALALFPDDPVLRFLEGCSHEVRATASIQSALVAARATDRRTFLRTGVRANEEELARAARSFRAALKSDPEYFEAALRLGRVLAQRGELEEAAERLRFALAGLASTPRLSYYAQLFLGDVEERRGNFGAARGAYEQAASLFPLAQKPLLALSQLAWREDARVDAWSPLKALLSRPAADVPDDPWSLYQTSHARSTDARIAALWRRITGEVP